MVALAEKNSFAEDQFGKKVDRCITDTLVKAGKLFINECENISSRLCKTWLIKGKWSINSLLEVCFLNKNYMFRLFVLGGGFLVGSVVSLLFFKRRTLPIWLGTGFGIGVGYRNCEAALNSNEKFWTRR